MKKGCTISIVIPLYNKECSIQRTLQTVLSQTYQDFEIVIVNDGSTDRSVAEAEKVQDSRIRIIHQINAGVSVARNKGIEEAQGEYIAFLDADDRWNKDYLLTQFGLASQFPSCDVFACNYLFEQASGKQSSTILRNLPFTTDEGILSNYFEVAACSHPPLWTSAVMARKTALKAVGGFPIGIKSGEDLLTWARLACGYQIAFSKKAMAVFCVEGYAATEKPKRIPAEDDVVGRELKKLWEQHPDRVGLRSYNSLWHKMRSSIYMRLGMRKQSIREALMSLKYNVFNYKVYAFILLNFIPFLWKKQEKIG